MRWLQARLLALATGSALVVGAPARAEAAAAAAEETRTASDRVVILPFVIEGSAIIDFREPATGALRTGLRRAGFGVVDVDVDAMNLDPGCLKASCPGFEKLRAETDANLVLRTVVRVDERDFEMTLDLIEVSTGSGVVSEDLCTICGIGEVSAVLATQGALLRTRLDLKRKEDELQAERDRRLAAQRDALARQPVLVVRSEPPGATVVVDGEAVGETPLERPVGVGAHVVTVRRQGYVSEERSVEVERGVKQRLNFALELSPDARLPPTRLSKALLIAGSVSAGLATVGFGLMAAGFRIGATAERDGEDTRASLEASGATGLEITDGLADVRARGRVGNTMALGGAIAGGVLLAGGVTMIVLSTTRRVRRVRADVAAGPTAWGLQISGRF